MNKNIVIKKTFNFGKIAYIGKRRTCPADVELTLYLENGHYELAIVGNIWNHLHTNAYIGGQCLEEMREYITAPTFNRLYSLWKSYHLTSDVNLLVSELRVKFSLYLVLELQFVQ